MWAADSNLKPTDFGICARQLGAGGRREVNKKPMASAFIFQSGHTRTEDRVGRLPSGRPRLKGNFPDQLKHVKQPEDFLKGSPYYIE